MKLKKGDLISDIIEIFNDLNVPLRYQNTGENISLPFAVYTRLETEVLYANNIKYIQRNHLKVEIYFSNLKNQIELEKKLEKKLEEKRYTFSKTEDIELDKNVFVVYFYIGGKFNE